MTSIILKGTFLIRATALAFLVTVHGVFNHCLKLSRYGESVSSTIGSKEIVGIALRTGSSLMFLLLKLNLACGNPF